MPFGRRYRRCWSGLLLAAALGPLAGPAAAQDVPPELAARVDRLLGELDAPAFATRDQAAAALEFLAAEASLAPYLAGRFRDALLSEATSFEVRSRLEPLVRSLPRAAAADPPPAAAEIGPQLERLNSDEYARRDSAARRIEAMLRHEPLIVPIFLELKRRWADPALSTAYRRALAPILAAAHEAWLLAEPHRVPLPNPADEQVAAWIDALVGPEPVTAGERIERDDAERELKDLIARDDTRPDALGMLREKIAAAGDSPDMAPLHELLEFSRPALAAEVWSNRTHIYQQYLILGMPQYNDTVTARKATLFDAVDDQTAHCVSGNALSAGDYPVRVAIPHPQAGQDNMYYLVNLSTPRRRLAYEYYLKRDERLRLAEISERTMAYFVNRQEPLSETEVLMLAQLDPRVVSRSIGAYLDTVRNGRLISTLSGQFIQMTVHGAIAVVLSSIGTREAVPALERLARSEALGKLSNDNRLDVPWIAALAIARRDPWEGVDAWLGGLLEQQRPLTTEIDAPPDLGASAAGLLLDRHGVSTAPFGLEVAGESMSDSLQFVGYRFRAEASRQDVLRWWAKQQALAAASSPHAAPPAERAKAAKRLPAATGGNPR